MTYFVTFRLADSLPQEKLLQWRNEREIWLALHPPPHDEALRNEYEALFPQRLQQWLDAGSGSCILAQPAIMKLVDGALRHFNGQRYQLDEFVVAPNHVHALLVPFGQYKLSEILHSWKSFTAHEIVKMSRSGRGVPPLSTRSQRRDASATRKRAEDQRRDASATRKRAEDQSRDGSATVKVKIWQKESFDHIVRSPDSFEEFCGYIRNHGAWTEVDAETARDYCHTSS